MKQTVETITVQIMDSTYPIRCPSDEIPALQKAAMLVDQTARQLHMNNRSLKGERLLLNACLNLAHDVHTLTESVKPLDKGNGKDIVAPQQSELFGLSHESHSV